MGIYSTFNWGDIQFFFWTVGSLDHEARTTGAKTMLGSTQFEWLMDAFGHLKLAR
jgi:alkaline phosphatase D